MHLGFCAERPLRQFAKARVISSKREGHLSSEGRVGLVRLHRDAAVACGSRMTAIRLPFIVFRSSGFYSLSHCLPSRARRTSAPTGPQEPAG